MRRKYTEIVMSIAAVGLVLLVLISFDGRVRQEFSLRMDAGAAAQAQAFGSHGPQTREAWWFRWREIRVWPTRPSSSSSSPAACSCSS